MSVSYTGAVDFETVAFMPDRQTEYGQGWSGNKVNVENGAWGPSFSDPAYANKMLPYGIPLYDFNGNGFIDYNPNDFTPAGDEDASIFSPFASFGKKQVKDFFKTGSIFQNTVTVNAGDGDGYVLLSLGNVSLHLILLAEHSDLHHGVPPYLRGTIAAPIIFLLS